MDRLLAENHFKSWKLGFPFEYHTEGGIVVLDRVKDEEISQVHKLYTTAAESGEGIAVDEHVNEDEFREYCRTSTYALAIREKNTNKLFAFTNLRDSLLSRSCKPIMQAGYLVTDQTYRKTAVAKELMVFWTMLGIQAGYLGMLARTGSFAFAALITAKRSGTIYIGLIPNGLNIQGKGWSDDQVTYAFFPDNGLTGLIRTKEGDILKEARKERHLPPLSVDFNPMHSPEPGPWINLEQILTQISKRNKRFEFKQIQTKSMMQSAEILLRSCAEKGQGFAIDEFDHGTGCFNRKLLRCPHDIVVLDKYTTTPVGCLIIGQSALCRSPSSPNLAAYFAVFEDRRSGGIGSHIVVALEEIAVKLGFHAILTDVFSCNIAGVSLMKKHNFIVTGTLPYCAIINKIGYEHSYLVYKRLVLHFNSARL